MNIRYILIASSLVLLAGCNEKSIDKLPEKSLAYIEQTYTGSPLHQWNFDKKPTASGNNTAAKIIVPEHKMAIIPPKSLSGREEAELKSFNLSLPEYTIDVTPVDANVATLKFVTDLSQIKLNMGEKLTRDANNVFGKFSIAGKLSNALDINLETKQSVKLATTSDLINLETLINDRSNPILNYALKVSNLKYDQQRQQNATTTDITAQLSIGELFQNIQDLSKTASEQKTTLKNLVSKFTWKGADNNLIAADQWGACTSELFEKIANDDYVGKDALTDTLNCYLKQIQKGTLGELTLTTDVPEVTARQALPMSPEALVTLKGHESSYIVEKDGYIELGGTNTYSDISIKLESNPNSAAMLKQAQDLIDHYQPGTLTAKSQISKIKRSSINSLTDISNEMQVNNFDLSELHLNIFLEYLIKDASISLDFNYTMPKNVTIGKLKELNPMMFGSFAEGLHIMVKIKNLDGIIEPIKAIEPSVMMMGTLIKGLGKADAKDPTLLTFEIILDKQLRPLVNGEPLSL